MPIAYTALGNTVEQHHHVKLNSKVPDRGGAYILDKPIKTH
jgi:hypothetical protein